MERRASIRRPIQLKAQLDIGGLRMQPCVIADFCAEGLFIQFGNAVSQAIHREGSEADALPATVRFSDGVQTHALQVQIVRLIEGAAGVVLTLSNPGAFFAMLQLCGSDYLEPPQVLGLKPSVNFVLRQCSRVLQHSLEPLFDQFLQEWPGVLRGAAESAANNQLRDQLQDTEMLFRNQGVRLRNLFLQQLISPLTQAEVPLHNGNPQLSATELSLIEKNEFEDWLTLKVMITKAETQYRASLLQLKMRLDKVGVVSQMGYQNPLGPPLICYAFRDLLLPLKLPQATERLCYRTFEKAVMKHLDGLYQELNNILIRQGVLPDLDLSRYLAQKSPNASINSELTAATSAESSEASVETTAANAESKAASAESSGRGAKRTARRRKPFWQDWSSRPAASAPDSAKKAPVLHPKSFASETPKSRKPSLELAKTSTESDTQIQNPPPVMQSAYRTVRNLFAVLDERREGHSLPAGVKAFPRSAAQSPSFSQDEVQQTLAQMQNKRRQAPASVDEPPLRQRLEASLRRHQGDQRKQIPREQGEPLDVVDQFLNSLMKNGRLTDVAKTQLRRLEIPLLKLLLRDRRLFDTRESPVHQVINRIALLGVKGGRPNASNNERIVRSLNRILDEFERDPAVFEEVADDLDDLLARQNQVFQRNVERVTAAAEGAQKVEDAKQVVAREVSRRIAGKRVPRAIVTLINGGWRDLLSLTYIRQGIESPAWQSYIGVLDTLLSLAENPQLRVNLPELLQWIQEGLASISSHHLPAGGIRDELKRFLMRQPDDPVEYVDMPEHQDVEANQELRQMSESRRRSLQRWLARVQKLRVGDRLKLLRDDEEPQYIQLAWVGKGFSRFVFVNYQGMKVVDWDAVKLATHLQRGIAVLDLGHEQPIVEQSLDAMIKDVYDQLSFVTTHDEVTDLINRKEFERSLQATMANASTERRLSLLYLELGQLKIVNDSAGYEAGDRMLCDIAQLLRRVAPENSLLARMDGNEFALLLNQEADAALDAQGVAQNCLRAVQDYRLLWESRQFTATLSVGIAEMSELTADVGQYLKAAKYACRRAKAGGPNRLEVLHADLQAQSQQAQIAAKVAGLSGDLKSERMLLRCQKIIPLKPETRMAAQYEILLSIYDDRGNLIPASDFVRMAERYNRMQVVDRWVVGHMLDWMAENRTKINSMGAVSINLSGHSLNDEELLEFIFERLTKTDTPIDKLCFEITEAAAIANIHDVAEFMEELREYGCRFCLGNFGAGMSSFQFLKTLPVDLIKIDGSFIKELEKDVGDQMMVRSMAEMAHFMGKELIATQVETKACLDMLSTLNVDYAQGYIIEKPRLLAGV